MTFDEVRVTGMDWTRGTDEPLETFSRRIEKISWDEVALDDRAAFDTNLRLSGLSEELISEALAVRDRSAAELVDAIERMKPYEGVHFFESPPDYIEAQHFYFAKRRNALQMLRDWWKQRVTVVESIVQQVEVPLFMLEAPSVPNCRAEWTNEIVSGISNGWTLQLAGSGFGSDAGSTYLQSASFEASSGQTKLIFCKVPLRLEHIEIREPKRTPVRQWRIDLTSVAEGEVWPSLRLLSADARPASGDFMRLYPLAEDPSASTAIFKESYSRSEKKKVDIGLDVRGAHLGLTATSDFRSSIEIKFTLKTGVDYRLFYARDCDGYLFGASPELS